MRSAYSSSQRRAETRLGLPRPSLDSMRSKSGHFSEVETDYDEDDYYEDEDEAAAEAFLSKQHGEASEDNSSQKKKTAKRSTDEDIEAEYAQQEKERKKKARKVIRTLTPEDLIKPKGLTVVRNGIAPKFTSQNYSNSTKSMAKFSRRLIGSYMDWMDDLVGLSLHETQWKLKTMGSKTQIKQYLQDMRKSVRDDHVERLLGLETAQRLLSQLEDYYNEEQQADLDDEPNYDDQDAPEQNSSPEITNPYAAANETAAAVTPTAAKPPQESAPAEKEEEEEDPLVRRLALQKEHRALKKHVLDDSDDEEQALFDDVVPAATNNTNKAARRHVLDDDSDDEDDDNEKQEQEEQADATTANPEPTNEEETETGKDETESDLKEVSASAQILDDKFESVKALLEGGDATTSNKDEALEEAAPSLENEGIIDSETEQVEEEVPTEDEVATEQVEEETGNEEASIQKETLLEDSENEF